MRRSAPSRMLVIGSRADSWSRLRGPAAPQLLERESITLISLRHTLTRVSL
jgi:hypothetical protein